MRERKVLLVTGASSDVGMTLIRAVADRYEFIWAHYGRSRKRIDTLRMALGEKLLPVRADLADEKETAEMIQTVVSSGRLPDHVVHLAAPKTHNQKFIKCAWEDYQDAVDVSLRSVVKLLQAVLPYMTKQRYGKVVFMLSSYVIGVPPKYQSPYITVKYALYGLMRNLSSEFSEKGVMINAVSPEMIETRFLDDIPDLVKEMNAEKNPLGRNLTVDDVVPTLLYLLSDATDAVSGQNIGISGGGVELT